MQLRPLQSRLQGPFRYLPLRSSIRGPEPDDESKARSRLLGVAQRLSGEKERDPDFHALGLSYLLLGKHDEAVKALEAALRRDTAEDDVARALQKSRNAGVIVALTSSYLERARVSQNVWDRVASLEAAQRAWSLAPGPESAWNRALALDAIHYREASRQAWEAYLRLDAGSGWSAEAQMRLAELRRPTTIESWAGIQPRIDAIAMGSDPGELQRIVAQFPQQMRIHAEDVLLPRWSATGDDETWRALSAIGAALAAERGEHVIRDIVTELDAASPEQRKGIRNAYRRYAAAKQQYERRQPLAALPELNEASRAFMAAGLPAMASLADVFASGALFFLERYADSLNVASRGVRRIEGAQRSLSLIVRLEWMRGLGHLALGRPHEALQAYDRALAAADAGGEMDFVAALQNLRGEALEAIGDEETGLEWRLMALQTKSTVGGRNKSEQILAGVARALFAQRRANSALQLIDTMMAHPAFGDGADFASEVLLLRGVILEQLERQTDARAALMEARAYALKSGDSAVNRAMLADIDATLAVNDTPSEPSQERVARLTAALDHAERTGNHYHRSRFLLQRGRAWRDTGDDESAEKDFRAGLAEVAMQRQAIPSREMRAMYFASARDLVTDLVALLLAGKRTGEAFDIAEEARAQGLLDANGRPGERKAMRHEEIMAGLGRGETLVCILALADRVVTWILTRNELRVSEAPVGRHRLETLLVRHHANDREAGRALYEAFVEGSDAAQVERYVFVADPALPPVMLSALEDRRGMYLIERFPIAYAPSATGYVTSAANAPRDGRSARTHVFAAAASHFDTTLFSNLPPLGSVEGEVARIASIYGTATSVTGARLTPKRFLAEAQQAAIIHFAGHAIGSGNAAGAALVMAPDGDAGLLYAREIAALPLRQTRLAVLSACGVSARRDVDGRTIGSLAYAFLAAGVPAVVAATREVDDRVAAQFMLRFHEELMKSGDAAIALQSTQLAMIRSGDPAARDPRNWASFRLYGHYER
jgi:CHAT domain-containing protein